MALGRYRLYHWFRFLGQSAHPHRRFRGDYLGCGVLHSGTCSIGQSKSSRLSACTALVSQAVIACSCSRTHVSHWHGPGNTLGAYPPLGELHLCATVGGFTNAQFTFKALLSRSPLLVQRSTLFLSTLCSSAYDRWSIARREYILDHNPCIDIGPGAFLSMCIMLTVLAFPILASSTTLAHPATCRAAVALRGLCLHSILHIHNRYGRIDIVAT